MKLIPGSDFIPTTDINIWVILCDFDSYIHVMSLLNKSHSTLFPDKLSRAAFNEVWCHREGGTVDWTNKRERKQTMATGAVCFVVRKP